MNRRVWQVLVTLICLVLSSALLSGCATRSASSAAGAESGDGPGRGGPGRGEPGGGGAEAMAGRPGWGSTASGTAARLATGASGANGGAGDGTTLTLTGTTIPALPSPAGFSETAALRDIHFDFDEYAIRPQEAKTLEENARWLRSNARATLLVEGHADERGTNEYNLALGERRAIAARDHLVALGVERARITVVSYGEERPVCSERTEGCWVQNRRAHFLVKP
jgi:peptidoglycan-associated lipoprotein